jgi:hypothetical protein
MKWENCKCKECGLCLGPTLRPCNGNIYTVCKEEKDWVSVKNSLPELHNVAGALGQCSNEVLVCCDKYHIGIGVLTSLSEKEEPVWITQTGLEQQIIYWRYLPDVPCG